LVEVLREVHFALIRG